MKAEGPENKESVFGATDGNRNTDIIETNDDHQTDF